MGDSKEEDEHAVLGCGGDAASLRAEGGQGEGVRDVLCRGDDDRTSRGYLVSLILAVFLS